MIPTPDAATLALSMTAIICLILVVYPYAIYPLLLRTMPLRVCRVGAKSSDRGREFALLFCAYNEADSLVAKIDNLRLLRDRYPELDILAYDDCSSDETADMLQNAEVGIRVLAGRERLGKAHGMKMLVAETAREFLVFTDANVELDPAAIDRLRSSYSDSSVGGVCGLLRYTSSEGTPTTAAGGAFWKLEELIKTLESRSGNVMGADGSIFSIRRSLYPEFPDSVLDDLTVSMSVIFAGKRLIKNPDVIAEERLVTSRTDDYRRRMRIATRAFHTHMWLRPNLRAMTLHDRWRYWSHRYMRWNGAFLLGLGVVTGLVALALSINWAVSVAVTTTIALIIALGFVAPLGPLSAIVHIVASIVVTGIGVARAWKGHTVTTWKPPSR